MIAWEQIESSPDYQTLSDKEKRNVKNGYLDTYVRNTPDWDGLDEDERNSVTRNFMGEQYTPSWGERARSAGKIIGEAMGEWKSADGLSDVKTLTPPKIDEAQEEGAPAEESLSVGLPEIQSKGMPEQQPQGLPDQAASADIQAAQQPLGPQGGFLGQSPAPMPQQPQQAPQGDFVGPIPDYEANFDPNGRGYDYRGAMDGGLRPDPTTGHLGSRRPDTGQMLKGRQHPTWNLAEQGEEEAGYKIRQGEDGRYYSQPPKPLSGASRSFDDTTDEPPQPDYFADKGGYLKSIEEGMAAMKLGPPARQAYADPSGFYPPFEDIPENQINDTFHGILEAGKAVSMAPRQMAAAALSGTRAGSFDVENPTWRDEFIKSARTDAKQYAAEAPDKTFLPGISYETIRRSPQNLGFSLNSMIAGLGTGIPTTALAGPLAGWGVGTAASGGAAFAMSKDQFTYDVYEFFNNQSLRARNKPLTQKEWAQIAAKTAGKRNAAALWEAVPEMVGNATMLGIMKIPVKMATNTLFGKFLEVGGKIAAAQIPEHITETITGVGRGGIEADIGMREKAPTPWEAFKEQAPDTTFLTMLLGGGGYAGTKAYERATNMPVDVGTLDIIAKDRAVALEAEMAKKRPTRAQVKELETLQNGKPAEIAKLYGFRIAPKSDKGAQKTKARLEQAQYLAERERTLAAQETQQNNRTALIQALVQDEALTEADLTDGALDILRQNGLSDSDIAGVIKGKGFDPSLIPGRIVFLSDKTFDTVDTNTIKQMMGKFEPGPAEQSATVFEQEAGQAERIRKSPAGAALLRDQLRDQQGVPLQESPADIVDADTLSAMRSRFDDNSDDGGAGAVAPEGYQPAIGDTITWQSPRSDQPRTGTVVKVHKGDNSVSVKTENGKGFIVPQKQILPRNEIPETPIPPAPAADILDRARSGDADARAQMERFGLPWEYEGDKYRFVGKEEVDIALSGKPVVSNRSVHGGARTDVTTNPEYGNVSPQSKFRIKFKNKPDLDSARQGSRVKLKNEKAKEYYIEGAYELNDIDTIEERGDDGVWKTVFTGDTQRGTDRRQADIPTETDRRVVEAYLPDGSIQRMVVGPDNIEISNEIIPPDAPSPAVAVQGPKKSEIEAMRQNIVRINEAIAKAEAEIAAKKGELDGLQQERPKVEPGRVWYKDQFRPFTHAEAIATGKNQGKFRITVGGKPVIVEATDVKSWPDGKEPIAVRKIRQGKPSNRIPNPEVDDAATFLRKIGGVNRDELLRVFGNRAVELDRRTNFGKGETFGLPLISRKGNSIARAGEALSEAGYIKEDWTENDVYAIIEATIQGKRVFSNQNQQAFNKQEESELERQEEEYYAAQEQNELDRIQRDAEAGGLEDGYSDALIQSVQAAGEEAGIEEAVADHGATPEDVRQLLNEWDAEIPQGKAEQQEAELNPDADILAAMKQNGLMPAGETASGKIRIAVDPENIPAAKKFVADLREAAAQEERSRAGKALSNTEIEKSKSSVRATLAEADRLEKQIAQAEGQAAPTPAAKPVAVRDLYGNEAPIPEKKKKGPVQEDLMKVTPEFGAGAMKGDDQDAFEFPTEKTPDAKLDFDEAIDSPAPPEADTPAADDAATPAKVHASFEDTPDLGIYRVRVKDRGEMFAVRDKVENPTGNGDALFDTVQEAQKEVEQETARRKDKEQRRQEQEKADQQAQKEKKDREDVDGFADDMTPLARGAAVRTLNEKIRYKGVVDTVKNHVRKLVDSGVSLEIVEEPAIKPMTRRQFNNSTQQEQDAHERRMREAGTKKIYYVGSVNLGKTAHDYAQFLINKKATPAAPKLDDFGEKIGGTYTLAEHKDIQTRAVAGELTAEEFQAAFQRAKDSQEALRTELEAMPKAKILEQMGGYRAERWKKDKKEVIVNKAVEDVLSDFTLGQGYSVMYDFSDKDSGASRTIKAITGVVEKIDQAYLDDHAASQKKAQEEREKAMAGAKDPKTLDDYLRYFGQAMRGEGKTFQDAYGALTEDQQATFDVLASEDSRNKRKADKTAKKTQINAAAKRVSGEVIETKHTKKGHDLFVVQPEERVDREIYNEWNTTAKRMGGYYSSFRGGGAIPGFQFPTREGADAFLAYLKGDTEAAKEAVKARRDEFEDNREQTAVERLRDMAEKLETRAQEKLSAPRQANTERRARFAAAAENAAEADIALAKTMRNIANAIEDGSAKTLDDVRQKTQVELLRDYVTRAFHEEQRGKYKDYGEREKHRHDTPTASIAKHLKYPSYTMFRSNLANFARQISEEPGTKLLGQRILKAADDVTAKYKAFAKKNLSKVAVFKKENGELAVFRNTPDAERAVTRSGLKGKAVVFRAKPGENIIIMSPELAREKGIWEGDDDARITLRPEVVEEVLSKIKRRKGIDVPWQLQHIHEERTRLQAMGIENSPELRAAIREFLSLQEQTKTPDKVKELERAMVGRQNDGMDFFPTPAETAKQMVDAAEIEEGMSVLEPSAGMGHIAEVVREAGIEPDVMELSGKRRELLEAKGFNVVGSDFIDEVGQYDRILMNPPFSDRRDAAHVRHAYDMLAPNGRVVAIMGEGVFFGQDKKAVEFREWLDSVGGTSEKLAEGTFQDKSLPVNTGVNARLVVIDKAENSASQEQKNDVQYRTREDVAGGTNPADIKKALNPFIKKIEAAGLTVKVATTKDDLGFYVPDNADGAILGDTIYLFADNLPDTKAAQRVLLDEAFGHRGIALMGKEGERFLNSLYGWHGAKINRYLRASGRSVTPRGAKAPALKLAGHIDLNEPEGRRLAAEEFFAHEARNNPTFQKTSAWRQFVAAVRRWLKAIGIDLEMSDGDIADMVRRAEQALDRKTGGHVDEARFAAAYHGTPHVWPPEPGFPHGRPRLDKIGTGEGAAAYGHGWYSAEADGVAKSYKQEGSPAKYVDVGGRKIGLMTKGDKSSYERDAALELIDANGDFDKARRRIENAYYKSSPIIKAIDALEKNGAVVKTEEQGSLYKLDIPDDVMPLLLDWDRPLSEQTEYVKAKLKQASIKTGKTAQEIYAQAPSLGMAYAKREAYESTGAAIYNELAQRLGSQQAASEYLRSIGIPGNRYFDQQSRYADATSNTPLKAMKELVGKGPKLTYNYVIWDQDVLDRVALLERNGEKLDAIREEQEARFSQKRPGWHSEASELINKYEETGEIETIRDLVDEIEFIAQDNDGTERLLDAVEKYRQEQADDLEFGMRGDMDAAEDAFLASARAAISSGDPRFSMAGPKFSVYGGHRVPGQLLNSLGAIHPEVDAFLSIHSDGNIILSELRMPKAIRGEGLGTKFMEVLTNFADREGRTIALTAAGDFGGSKSGQQRFYKRHGFVMNKGRNKDYRINENMIRRPKEGQPKFSQKMDADYLAAVERGDMETAQKMVDEAAKKAGYDGPYYHGGEKGINVFRVTGFDRYDPTKHRPIWITDKKGYAKAYAKRKGLHQGQVYALYAKDTYQLPTIKTEFTVKESSNVKSADPVTYDDNGDVIPLSKRFDMVSDDIRFSQKLKKAGDEVDGRTVLSSTPNMDSIEATFDDGEYNILDGVREVPMSDFYFTGESYSVSENARIKALAEKIKESNEIAPLIAVYGEKEGPYILEGGHRGEALHLLGAKSFPAVVVDVSSKDIRFSQAADRVKNTPEFKQWFKDSKVTDENGDPLVVYHGTDSPTFAKFQRSYTRGLGGPLGFWFASKAEATDSFARQRWIDQGPAIYPVFLSIKNPFQYNGYSAFRDHIDKLRKGKDIESGVKAIRRQLVKRGYDGVVIKNSDTDGGVIRDDFIAFEPTQIKSVFNHGTFDSGKKDIRFSTRKGPEDVQRATQKLHSEFANGNEEKAKSAIEELKAAYLTPIEGSNLDKANTEFLQHGDPYKYAEQIDWIGDLKPSELGRVEPDIAETIAPKRDKVGEIVRRVVKRPDGSISSQKEPVYAVKPTGMYIPKAFDDGITKMLDDEAQRKFGKPFEKLSDGQRERLITSLDISPRDRWNTDPTRLFQKMDQGVFGEIMARHIHWPAQRGEEARLAYTDKLKKGIQEIADTLGGGKKHRIALFDVSELVGSDDVNVDAKTILNGSSERDKNIQAVLNWMPKKEAENVIKAAQMSRKWYDKAIDQVNAVRAARKQDPIKKRANYVPHLQEINWFTATFGPEQGANKAALPDYIHPAKHSNPREKERAEWTAYKKNKDAIRLLLNWADNAGKDIFNTNAIQHNKIYAQYLKDLGLVNAADFVQVWSDEVFGGIKPAISKVAEGIFHPTVHKAGMGISKGLTRAVFPLNFGWNMFIQTSSAGLTLARYGAVPMVYGLRYLTNKGLRNTIDSSVYSASIKSRWSGSVAYQDTSNGITKNKKLETSKIEKAEHFANFLTQEIERALTGHAIAAAYYHGKKKLGLSGRELLQYASEGGSKTQSMYNHADKVGLLRAPEIGALAKFQTFAFEMFNTLREIDLPGINKVVGRTGAYKTMAAANDKAAAKTSEKLKIIARFYAATVVANAAYSVLVEGDDPEWEMLLPFAGSRPWQPTAFIPFAGLIFGTGNAGSPIGALPLQYIQDFKKAATDLLAHDSLTSLRRFIFRYHIPAGIQLTRFWDGIEAYARGGVFSASGRRLYDVDDDELFKVLFFGPWKSREGLEYSKRFDRSIIDRIKKARDL